MGGVVRHDGALVNPLALLHHLANHPDIIRWVAPGRREVDVSRHNVSGTWIFGDEDGAVLFDPISVEKGIYEMHYLFTEARRGKAALDLIRSAVQVMFTEHEATVICGAVPREHRASRVMSRALGAQPVGSHTDSSGRACVVYKLERKSWATSSAAS